MGIFVDDLGFWTFYYFYTNGRPSTEKTHIPITCLDQFSTHGKSCCQLQMDHFEATPRHQIILFIIFQYVSLKGENSFKTTSSHFIPKRLIIVPFYHQIATQWPHFPDGMNFFFFTVSQIRIQIRIGCIAVG